MMLKVYTNQSSARVAYAFSLLFESAVQLSYQLTDSPAGAHLAYTPEAVPQVPLWLPAHGLLNEKGVSQQSIDLFQHEGKPAFFGIKSADALLPFDLPAMAFYLASRYEEYLPFEPDQHGRFPARASLAYQGGFLRQPLINQWALDLAQKIQIHFPTIQLHYPKYRFRPSYDIDLAWAYLHRPLWLRAAGTLRDLLQGKASAIARRWRVSRGKATDPFFTFRYLDQQHQRLNLSPIYFFLLGDHDQYDKNISTSRPALRHLLASLSHQHETGVHPSYSSNERHGQLEKECKRYKRITGKAPKRSRQHYLKLQFPSTYLKLLQQGIQEDYTMGFADDVGFRASMATPFLWYDIGSEQQEELMIHPFPLMDGSLKHYLGQAPEEASATITQLINEVRAVGGHFIPLWHNSSFSATHGWAGWKSVFEQMLERAAAD